MNKIIRYEPFGSLVHFTEDCTTLKLNKDETEELLGYDGNYPTDLSGPEIVHLELTGKCNKNCDYCYINHNQEGLSTREWKFIIDELAENKIFQVTFGGKL